MVRRALSFCQFGHARRRGRRAARNNFIFIAHLLNYSDTNGKYIVYNADLLYIGNGFKMNLIIL